jgi:hypothetical protein
MASSSLNDELPTDNPRLNRPTSSIGKDSNCGLEYRTRFFIRSTTMDYIDRRLTTQMKFLTMNRLLSK